MADETAYYYVPQVSQFQVLLEEVTRATPGSPESRFIQPEGSVVDRLGSRFHHVLFGRRGTGKSSLLHHVETGQLGSGRLVAWADQETFMGLSYPDVLVSTLAEVFGQFQAQMAAGSTADTRRRILRRRKSDDDPRLVVVAALSAAVAQLEKLKAAPSESDVEWGASFSDTSTTARKRSWGVGGRKGPVEIHGGGESFGEQSRSDGGSYTHRFSASKAEHLERAVPTYRALIKQVTAMSGDAFIILDDFYRLALNDQPSVAGYFHRVVKDTKVWLKIGSIRYWTKLYSGGSPAVGLQIPHDVRALSLDRGLLDFKASKRFLEEILSALAAEVDVSVERLFTHGALDRLVLASGGVPRDYIGLISESIAVAKNRGPSAKAGSDRVIAEDVNEAAGRTVEVKFDDLIEDAGSEAVLLRDIVVDLTNHCRSTKSACFLIDYRDQSLVDDMNRLQNMRFVHSIDTNESLPDAHSSRYNVYLLDVSQLAAQRAWQVDFMGWTRREQRRNRKLVFHRPEGPHVMSEASGPAEQQLPFPDAQAVVAQIDPPVGNPDALE